MLYISFNLSRQLTFLAMMICRILMYAQWMERMQSQSCFPRLSQIKQLKPQVSADMALLQRLSTTLLICQYNIADYQLIQIRSNYPNACPCILFSFTLDFEDKINNMYQQKPYSLNKPAKSLSVRAFPKSARKQQPLTSRRNETMPSEPIQLFSQTKKQFDLDGKTSRILTFQPKKSNFNYKPPQQLLQENHTLKMKINYLSDVLGKQRCKKDHDKRNYSKIHEKLEIEFSEEKYFDLLAKNNNLVEGVKYQYYKMKQKYEDKCAEYEDFYRRVNATSLEECRIYVETLEADNAKLKGKIATFVNIEEKLQEEMKDQQKNNYHQRRSRNTKNEEETQINQLIGLSSQFTFLEKRTIDAEEKIEKYEKKIIVLKANLKEKRKKIEFLDILLTQKSNEVHHAVLKERRLSKQFKSQAETIDKLKKILKQQQQKHKEALQLLKEKEEMKFITQKNIFTRCLKQKQTEVEKLKQEIYYLSTIISYIKTGQDPFKIQPNLSNLSKKASYKQHSQQFLQNLEKTLISIEGDHFSNRKRVKTLIESGFKQLNSPRLQTNTENLKQIQVISDSEDEGESVQGSPTLRESLIEDAAPESRMPKKSHIKHSEGAIKVRSVKPSQIESFKKELVYRFMFYKLQVDEAKEFLSLSKEEQSKFSKRERKWRHQYATLKEIREKLQTFPFDLKEEEALLLSRYIVEDCTKDNVYFHEENEIQRTIAKSILRAFVGQYSIPDEERSKQEVRIVLGKYGKNLKSALQSLAPTGYISSLKFCEICEAIQVDFSEESKNFILSQLLSKSKAGLSHLQYGIVFNGLP